jgi:pimeloyl-ACP methyl ester carboxylesterase
LFHSHKQEEKRGNKETYLYLTDISKLEYLHYVRKIRASTSSILICIFFLVVIFTLPIITTNTTGNRVYGQANPMNLTIADLPNIQSIPPKKVHVGDIDIAYKMLGTGEPILLISGASSDMNAWESSTLRDLSLNHTVIVFDNRGVGNTTTGSKPFSIQQLANDTAGLLDALRIGKADVLGYSLGSFTAQQLTITYPEKVNRLVLVASSCGGEDSVPKPPQFAQLQSEIVDKTLNNVSLSQEEIKSLISASLGSGWIRLHPESLEDIPEAQDVFASISPNTIMQQNNIGMHWEATNWNGACDELARLAKPTLVITGTDDNAYIPYENSLIIAGKIPGAWLIQIENAGHAVMSQYPDEINKILQTFLSTTTTQPE